MACGCEVRLAGLDEASATRHAQRAIDEVRRIEQKYSRYRADSIVGRINRAAGGPPMPVAVQKHAPGALPLSITLSDADNLMPTATLSALDEIEVVARLSMSGTANKQPGDVDSEPVRVKLPVKQPVKLTIGNE